MGHVRITTTCHAPSDVAFAYLDDYRNVREWMYGIKSFEPAGELHQGLGAVFDATVRIGAILHTKVEVTEWEQDRAIVLTAIEGFPVAAGIRLHPVDPEHTELSAEVDYHFPGGMAGRALEKVVEPFVSTAARYVEHTITRNVEVVHAQQGSEQESP